MSFLKRLFGKVKEKLQEVIEEEETIEEEEIVYTIDPSILAHETHQPFPMSKSVINVGCEVEEGDGSISFYVYGKNIKKLRDGFQAERDTLFEQNPWLEEKYDNIGMKSSPLKWWIYVKSLCTSKSSRKQKEVCEYYLNHLEKCIDAIDKIIGDCKGDLTCVAVKVSYDHRSVPTIFEDLAGLKKVKARFDSIQSVCLSDEAREIMTKLQEMRNKNDSVSRVKLGFFFDLAKDRVAEMKRKVVEQGPELQKQLKCLYHTMCIVSVCSIFANYDASNCKGLLGTVCDHISANVRRCDDSKTVVCVDKENFEHIERRNKQALDLSCANICRNPEFKMTKVGIDEVLSKLPITSSEEFERNIRERIKQSEKGMIETGVNCFSSIVPSSGPLKRSHSDTDLFSNSIRFLQEKQERQFLIRVLEDAKSKEPYLFEIINRMKLRRAMKLATDELGKSFEDFNGWFIIEEDRTTANGMNDRWHTNFIVTPLHN